MFVPPAGANAEEAMIAEAIRRSLLDSSGVPEVSSGLLLFFFKRNLTFLYAASEPQSSISENVLPAASPAAPAPRRLALEDPSETDSATSSGEDEDDEAEDAALQKKKSREVPAAQLSDDAELNEAIRLSLMADQPPAAMMP